MESTHKRPRNTTTEMPKEKNNKTATEPEPLSRLCSYPNTEQDKNCGSKLQHRYAPLAVSIRNTLISNLTCDDSDENIIDIDSMIDFSNTAFASLNLFHANYRDLYDVVKEFILNQCKHLELEKEHRLSSRRWVRSMFCKTDRDKAKGKFEIAKASVTKAEAEAASLEAQVQEALVLLKGLTEKLEKENKEVEFLQSESNRLEKTYVDSEAEFHDVDKKLYDIKLRIVEQCDEIKRSKAKLCALRRREPMH